MDKLRIVGRKRLTGSVAIGGAKNASLPAMAASLLVAVACGGAEVEPTAEEAPAEMAATLDGSVPINDLPNPYSSIDGWGKLPDGREWGSTSAVYPGSNGTIWVGERCGQNSCVGSGDDPILQFDRDGNLINSFGAGLINWPHGIHVDSDNNIWVTDAACPGCSAAARNQGKLGHQIIKFNSSGSACKWIEKVKNTPHPFNDSCFYVYFWEYFCFYKYYSRCYCVY